MVGMSRRERILTEIAALAPQASGREVALDDRLSEDLGLDSVGLLTLAVAVEDHFRICLEPEDEARIRTVGDLVRTVEEKLGD